MSLPWKVLAAGVFSLTCGGLLTAGLTEKNPFVWPDFEPPENRRPTRPEPTRTRGEEMEFHAIYELDGVTRALIRNRSNQSFKWVTLGEESEDGIVAKSYNRENDQLLLANSDGERWLDLESTAAPTGRPSGPGVQRPTPTLGPRSAATARAQPSTSRGSSIPSRTSRVTTRQGETVQSGVSSSTRTRLPPRVRTRSTAVEDPDPGLRTPSAPPPQIDHLEPPAEGPPSGKPPPPPEG